MKKKEFTFGSNERITIFGASGGLGAQVIGRLRNQNSAIEIQSISRTSDTSFDLSHENEWDAIILAIKNFNSTRIFYFAGGGPYGDFATKEWKDHLWAIKVNLLFPAFLLHHLMQAKPSLLTQVIFCGSAVAESAADPGAASYAASKHGLKGLILSVIAEGQVPFDLRLFSPSYFSSKMLGPKARAKLSGRVMPVERVAEEFIQWMQVSDDAQRHFELR